MRTPIAIAIQASNEMRPLRPRAVSRNRNGYRSCAYRKPNCSPPASACNRIGMRISADGHPRPEVEPVGPSRLDRPQEQRGRQQDRQAAQVARLDPGELVDLRRCAQEQGVQLARDVDDAEEAVPVLRFLEQPRDERVAGLKRRSEPHVVVDEVADDRQRRPGREWRPEVDEPAQARAGVCQAGGRATSSDPNTVRSPVVSR